MAKYQELDGVFQSLADPTRRAVLDALGHGEMTVSELAEPFEMALPSFMKHIRQLERSGWIRTRKSGRTRRCAIDRSAFDTVEGWLAEQRQLWEQRTDRLERFVTTTDHEGESTP